MRASATSHALRTAGHVPAASGAGTEAVTFTFSPIGTLYTCFQEKFGVPRQSMMMPEAFGVLKLNPDPAYRKAFAELDQFSHLWLVFVFHKLAEKKWRPTTETPRVEASRPKGVFATRSPRRPNPIGLSAVKLERVDFEAKGGIEIHLSGVDILDGTPVLDVKPYLPYADRIASANSGWVTQEIPKFPVAFSRESLVTIETRARAHPTLRALIENMLALDPRPTSQRKRDPLGAAASEGKRFAFRVLDLDVRWEVRRGTPYVYEVVPIQK